MSDSVALSSSSVQDERTTKPAPRFSVGNMLRTAMEALVASHSRQFEGAEPMFYRYPPI
jgi:hypothetical protein